MNPHSGPVVGNGKTGCWWRVRPMRAAW
jgi:hypothetical protein